MDPILYFILLSILPLAYKLSFWLYVVQLKEYRCDRLKDYLKTPQWKKAVFNFWFWLELIVLVLAISFAFGKIPEKIMYYSLVFLLQFESLYVFYKIFTLKFPAPKFTKRMIILASLSVLTIILTYLEMFLNPIYTYLVLPKLLVFLPVIVVFWNALTGIFFDKVKEKIFKQAENKIKSLNIHTIAITWSYGKSSTKEFLSALMEDKFNVIKTPKNINTEIWVSQFILNQLENKITSSSKPSIFIAEAWAYSKWEISRMWKILNHKDGFLTGLGNQHIGLFGSQQNLVDAKFEIWEKVLENWWKLYLNTSNLEITPEKIKIWFPINQEVKTPEIYHKLKENRQIVRYPDDIKMMTQEDNHSELVSESLESKKEPEISPRWQNAVKSNSHLASSDFSSDLKITSINEEWTQFSWNNETFQTNIVWVGLIENLIWAMKFALNNWVSLEQIKEKIKNLPLPEHTMKIYEKKVSWPLNYKVLYIDDSYNLSVNSLINAINTAKYLKWKKLLVLDDILELWNQAHQIHQKLWEYLASKIDEILFIGVNYKKDIEKWLKSWWFKWKILDKFPHILEDYVVILEWRKAGRYLPKKV